ncbi:MAG: hypothetical protein ACRC1K_15480 [Planctomycetia bacterium]
MKDRGLTFLAATILFTSAFGCGSNGPALNVVALKGKISIDGGAMVPQGSRLEFEPMEGRRVAGLATVAADGSFEPERATGGKGLEEGSYQLSLFPPPNDAGEFAKVVPKKALQEKFITNVEVRNGMAPLEITIPK